jgi:hypothetical protein
VLALGSVLSEVPGYCDSSHVYPVGYQALRSFTSAKDASAQSDYHLEIRFGGLPPQGGPLFVVKEFGSMSEFSGRSPTEVWKDVVSTVRQAGKLDQPDVDGDFMFGLSVPTVQVQIESLPGADRRSRPHVTGESQSLGYSPSPTPVENPSKVQRTAERSSASSALPSSRSTRSGGTSGVTKTAKESKSEEKMRMAELRERQKAEAAERKRREKEHQELMKLQDKAEKERFKEEQRRERQRVAEELNRIKMEKELIRQADKKRKEQDKVIHNIAARVMMVDDMELLEMRSELSFPGPGPQLGEENQVLIKAKTVPGGLEKHILPMAIEVFEFANFFGEMIGCEGIAWSAFCEAIQDPGCAIFHSLHVALVMRIFTNLKRDNTFLGRPLNALTWPELLRQYICMMQQENLLLELREEPSVEDYKLEDLCMALDAREYEELPLETRLELLVFNIELVMETHAMRNYVDTLSENLFAAQADKRQELGNRLRDVRLKLDEPVMERVRTFADNFDQVSTGGDYQPPVVHPAAPAAGAPPGLPPAMTPAIKPAMNHAMNAAMNAAMSPAMSQAGGPEYGLLSPNSLHVQQHHGAHHGMMLGHPSLYAMVPPMMMHSPHHLLTANHPFITQLQFPGYVQQGGHIMSIPQTDGACDDEQYEFECIPQVDGGDTMPLNFAAVVSQNLNHYNNDDAEDSNDEYDQDGSSTDGTPGSIRPQYAGAAAMSMPRMSLTASPSEGTNTPIQAGGGGKGLLKNALLSESERQQMSGPGGGGGRNAGAPKSRAKSSKPKKGPMVSEVRTPNEGEQAVSAVDWVQCDSCGQWRFFEPGLMPWTVGASWVCASAARVCGVLDQKEAFMIEWTRVVQDENISYKFLIEKVEFYVYELYWTVQVHGGFAHIKKWKKVADYMMQVKEGHGTNEEGSKGVNYSGVKQQYLAWQLDRMEQICGDRGMPEKYAADALVKRRQMEAWAERTQRQQQLSTQIQQHHMQQGQGQLGYGPASGPKMAKEAGSSHQRVLDHASVLVGASVPPMDADDARSPPVVPRYQVELTKEEKLKLMMSKSATCVRGTPAKEDSIRKEINEMYLDRLEVLRFRSEPLGFDRFYNAYWVLGGDYSRLWIEQPENKGWGVIGTVQDLLNLMQALDVFGVRECALKEALDTRMSKFEAAMADDDKEATEGNLDKDTKPLSQRIEDVVSFAQRYLDESQPLAEGSSRCLFSQSLFGMDESVEVSFKLIPCQSRCHAFFVAPHDLVNT